MIIGTKVIDEQEIISLLRQGEDITSYVENLVPRLIRTPEVVGNQRYYIALRLRKNKTLSYYQKAKFCEIILDGAKITGSVNNLIDFRDILGSVNMDKLMQYVFNKELYESRR